MNPLLMMLARFYPQLGINKPQINQAMPVSSGMPGLQSFPTSTSAMPNPNAFPAGGFTGVGNVNTVGPKFGSKMDGQIMGGIQKPAPVGQTTDYAGQRIANQARQPNWSFNKFPMA